MTATELKNLIRSTLAAPRQIAQEYAALDAIIDFVTASSTSGIPEWSNTLTFNLDGSGDGSYSVWPDTNGAIRFWKTKTDNNTGNAPPTAPATTENTWWIEVSPSPGSGIQEWASGIYGSGLVIVFHNHSTKGPSLYQLVEPVRPFSSTNIETEIIAGRWARISDDNVTAPAGSLILCGTHDAGDDDYPATGGTGTGGAVARGNIFISDGSGTTEPFDVPGAWLVALIDAPGQTPTNWQTLYPS